MKLAFRIALLVICIGTLMIMSLDNSVTAKEYAATPTATTISRSPQLPVITAQNAARLTKFAVIPDLPDDSIWSPTWSPDGKYLAISSIHALMLFDTSDFAASPRLIKENLPSVQFSPDSQLLAVYSRHSGEQADDQIGVYEVSSGKKLYSGSKFSEVGIDSLMGFSPDGAYLAASNGLQIYLLEPRTGKIIATFPGSDIAFNHDGSLFATLEDERFQVGVAIWSPVISWGLPEKITGIRINDVNAVNLALSPSGSEVAVRYADSDVSNVTVFNIYTGEQLHKFPNDYTGSIDLLFSPDGHMLAMFGPGQTTLWDLTANKSWEFNYSSYDAGLYGGIFNNDGTLLLYWDYSNVKALPSGNLLRVWSIPDQCQLNLLTDASNPAFSPDGTMLATWNEEITIWAVTP